jgi:hypothetical protein
MVFQPFLFDTALVSTSADLCCNAQYRHNRPAGQEKGRISADFLMFSPARQVQLSYFALQHIDVIQPFGDATRVTGFDWVQGNFLQRNLPFLNPVGGILANVIGERHFCPIIFAEQRHGRALAS